MPFYSFESMRNIAAHETADGLALVTTTATDVASAVLTLTTSQVDVTGAETALAAANADRVRLRVRNLDTVNDVAIGLAGVTATTGFLLKPGADLVFELTSGLVTTAAIVGITGGATVRVAIAEESR